MGEVARRGFAATAPAGRPARRLPYPSAVLMLGSCSWFAVNVHGPIGLPLLWLPLPVACLVAGWYCLRAAAGAGRSAVVRRFWRWMAVSVLLIGVGTACHAGDALGAAAGPSRHVGPAALTCYALATVIVVWAMYRLPFGTGNRSERITLWLDVVAVMLTAGLFMWRFSGRLVLPGQPDDTASLVVRFALRVLALVAVFAIAKATLAGGASIDVGALRLLAATVVVGAVASVPLPVYAGRPHLMPVQLVVPVMAFLLAWAAGRQRAAPAAEPAGAGPPAERRRPFSVLAYVSVAATHVLLLTTLSAPDRGDARLIAVGAAALTGLVVVRQLMAFGENSRLMESVTLAESRFRSLVQNASDVIAIMTAQGTITYLSPGVERVLGVPAETWLGRSCWSFVHPEDRARVAAATAPLLSRPGATVGYQVRLAHRDGSWRWAEVISANLLDEPSVAGIVSNARDVTETRRFQDRLSHEATHDALTQLANRTLFRRRVEAALASAPDPSRISVAVADLDDFKTVNDSLGHAAGDALLVIAAERLCRSVRQGDTVARLGGDEFALVLAELPPGGVERVLDRIIEAFQAPAIVEGHELLVRASIGVASGHPGATACELLRQADVAMYAAKARDEGRYVRYTPDLSVGARARARLGQELHAALREDQLRLHYQPVVTLPEGALTGVEALVRWQHPSRGLLLPGEFVSVAERNGLIVPLGRWVLTEACRQAAGWQARSGRAAPGVSVNLSPRQLREPELAGQVAAILAGAGLAPERLTIEVTETTAVRGALSVQNLAALRGLGVRIALDDFGTGESSLSLLQDCPLDELKLDRSFTQHSATLDQLGVAAAVIHLAKALGLDAIAEGVETQPQADALHRLGYRQAQGYHFAEPLPPAAIDDLIGAPRPDRLRSA